MIDVKQVVRQCLPAVVSVRVLREEQQESVFGRGRAEASGSGVILEGNLLITNAHVVGWSKSKTKQVEIETTTKKKFAAKIVYVEDAFDLALCKIEITSGKTLPFVKLGRADQCEVGEAVLAIGNPFGLSGTVTDGIVSCVGRRLPHPLSQERSGKGYKARKDVFEAPLIQTSASINPGSSGGALVNMNSELIGVNQCIMSPAGGSVGLGFAVPANYIWPLIYSNQRGLEKVERPYLGIHLSPKTPDDGGILVAGVSKAGMAAKAGIMKKDVIMKMGGDKFDDVERFLMAVNRMKIGSTADFKIKRNGKTIRFPIEFGSRSALMKESPTKTFRKPPFLKGAQVGDLNPMLNSQLGFNFDRTGVVVLKSPSSMFALREKDVILEINGRVIQSINDIDDALNLEGDKLVVKIDRNGMECVFKLSTKNRKNNIRSKL